MRFIERIWKEMLVKVDSAPLTYMMVRDGVEPGSTDEQATSVPSLRPFSCLKNLELFSLAIFKASNLSAADNCDNSLPRTD